MSPLTLVLLGVAVVAIYWVTRGSAAAVESQLDAWVKEKLREWRPTAGEAAEPPLVELCFERSGQTVHVTLDARAGAARRAIRKKLDWSEVPEAVRARFLSGEESVVQPWSAPNAPEA